jgi:V8-like Glu-specific endopeptidase
MKHVRTAVIALGVMFVLASPGTADTRGPVARPVDHIEHISPERAPGTFDPVAYTAEMHAKAARLEAVEVAAGFDSPIVVTVTHDDILAIERGDAEERRYRVGIAKPVSAVIDLAPAPTGSASHTKKLGWGAVRTDADGAVWSGAVSAPGATSLRLHISDFNLPSGTELWIYNRLGEAFGPYTKMGPGARGEFWTNTVAGSEILLQVRHRGSNDTLKSVYFEIDEVGYLGDRFVPGLLRTMPASAKSFCTFNEPCVENAACDKTSSAVDTARDAVALMLFRSGGFFYICTGGLIADSDTGSQIPYFLTANHCISKGREASSLETYFNFTTPCGGACGDPTTPGTLGAEIVASSRTGDYTLLRLGEPAPGGTAFLGWDSNPVAYADGTPLYRISHPAGAPQAYSEHAVDTSKGTCSSWPRGNWIYSQDIVGATEGGSSGSPVVNGDGEVVGQLSGACGYNVNDPCDSNSNATVDGAFAAYFNQVAPWLAGGGTSCSDGDGDGFTPKSCGGTDCDDGDASIYPGATEICGDNIDNNCDGLVDGQDPSSCPGGECTPVGDSCSTDSDCCTNKCRGRGTDKICR